MMFAPVCRRQGPGGAAGADLGGRVVRPGQKLTKILSHMARLLRVAMVDMLSELILFLSRSVSHTVIAGARGIGRFALHTTSPCPESRTQAGRLDGHKIEKHERSNSAETNII